MQETDEWEKHNIVFYLKYLFKQKHHRLFFEDNFKFDTSHNFPTLDIDAKSKRRTDFSNIAIEHKVLSIHHNCKKADNDFFYYTISVRGAESITQLLIGTRLFICKILNEHCLHNPLRPWNKAPSGINNKEIIFYTSQEASPEQETASEKEHRIRAITTAASNIWRFITGGPIKNVIKICDKSLVDGSLSHERVEGTGLLLKLTRPNLEKLNNLATAALHEKQKKLPPKPPSPELKLHLSDEEELKHVKISDKPPKIMHYTRASNTTMFKPPIPLLNKPTPPSINAASVKGPNLPVAKPPATFVIPPAPSINKQAAISHAPIAAKSAAAVKREAPSRKRSSDVLSVPIPKKSKDIEELDEILRNYKEKKARQLKLQNRGEDEKTSVLNISENNNAPM